MKKIFLLIGLATIILNTSCSERLDVLPTERVSGDGMMNNNESAMLALDGLYRYMYRAGQTVGNNGGQVFGPNSYALAGDVMAEDMIMADKGSGWFWYDALYNVKSFYTGAAFRSYDCWRYCTQIVSNVNYILAAKETMQGPKAEVDYIIGQAYALRAYAYNFGASWFARTYIGHENEKGMCLYTEPTVAGTAGQPRSTLKETYEFIRADIDSAINILKTAPSRKHKSHIDYNVACMFKAEICLITNEWEEALVAAQEAQIGYTVGDKKDVVAGLSQKSSFNDVSKPNVIWGAVVRLDQNDLSLMSHIDSEKGNYAGRASGSPKLISKWLYNKISPTDIRREWWDPIDALAKEGDEKFPYIQSKFRFYDYANSLADRVYLRVEQAVLIEAEALCRLGRDAEAIVALKKLMDKRDPNYKTTKTGTALGALTTDETGSLLEEIILQRRIELWGELGRIFDIKRLKQGFKRTVEHGHTQAAVTATDKLKVNNPETYDWVLTIPKNEFNSNEALNEDTDQNPIGSGI